MNRKIISEKDGFLIRPASAEDAADYYEQNYCPLDKDVARLTGCKEVFNANFRIGLFHKTERGKGIGRFRITKKRKSPLSPFPDKCGRMFYRIAAKYAVYPASIHMPCRRFSFLSFRQNTIRSRAAAAETAQSKRNSGANTTG